MNENSAHKSNKVQWKRTESKPLFRQWPDDGPTTVMYNMPPQAAIAYAAAVENVASWLANHSKSEASRNSIQQWLMALGQGF